MTKTRMFCVAGLILLSIAASGQQLSDDQIAERFMPPSFTAYAADHPYIADDRAWNILRVDLDHTGRPDYLAIGYTNHHIGFLRVVRSGNSPVLAGDSAVSTACESMPSISAVDLDGDGRPELDFRCRVGNRGTQFSSLFKWTGSAIVRLNLSDPHRAGAWIPIREANFADIDGDGVLDVLEAAADTDVDSDGSLTQHYDVYKLNGGTLGKTSARIVYFNQFSRGKGKPAAETDKFTADPGVYVITIANGARGENMVDSAVITINGATIASQHSFPTHSRVLRSDVTLAEHNTISVELNGAPGSFLYVTITPTP